MNQILYTGEVKKKKIVSKKDGMILISILLIIFAITIIAFNISSLNTTAKAMSQNEVVIEKLAQENLIAENYIQENSVAENSEKENIILPKEIEEEKEKTEPVMQTVQGYNGKSYETIAILKIPSLNIEYPVLSSTSTELLKISLNKYWGANPNEVGNMCIVGHNYNDSRFFGKLNQIKTGAEIYITDMSGKTLTYKVYHTEMVDPYDTECTSQLTNGNIEITLITCNYDGSQRFVVKARASD